jgi:hypothetical protein
MHQSNVFQLGWTIWGGPGMIWGCLWVERHRLCPSRNQIKYLQRPTMQCGHGCMIVMKNCVFQMWMLQIENKYFWSWIQHWHNRRNAQQALGRISFCLLLRRYSLVAPVGQKPSYDKIVPRQIEADCHGKVVFNKFLIPPKIEFFNSLLAYYAKDGYL